MHPRAALAEDCLDETIHLSLSQSLINVSSEVCGKFDRVALVSKVAIQAPSPDR
jgi:hypothetical protein